MLGHCFACRARDRSSDPPSATSSAKARARRTRAASPTHIGAGEILATLTGNALREVRIDVSAGSLVASLPDAEYAVTSDVSAGSFDNELDTSPGAARTVDVQVAAGGVTLRPTP